METTNFSEFQIKENPASADYVVGYDIETLEEIQIPVSSLFRQGADGRSLQVQYSQDAENWHQSFMRGDTYMRQKLGTAAWTDAILIRGVDGKDGVDGVNGKDGTNGTSGKDGSNGLSLYVEYSADTVKWHSTFQKGDLYMRQKLGDSGTWSDAMQIGIMQQPAIQTIVRDGKDVYIIWDAANSNTASYVNDKNALLDDIVNKQAGAIYRLVASNADAVISFSKNFLFPSGVTPTLTKGGVDVFEFLTLNSGEMLLVSFMADLRADLK
jgi:hypothetical protein